MNRTDATTIAVARHRARARSLLARLVAAPEGPARPAAVAAELAGELAAAGLEVTRLPVDVGALAGHAEFSPPTLATAPEALVATDGRPGPALLLFAHTDSEPAHPGWRGDPRRLVADGDRLTGLGVADDAAGVVNVLWALWARADLPGERPPVRVVLAAAKQGGSLGMLPAVASLTGVGAAVYCHPAESGLGLRHLKTASRGVATLRVHVPGRTPEPVETRTPVSADPREGVSAAARAARLAATTADRSGPELVTEVVAQAAGAAPFEVPATATFDLACWFTSGTVDDLVHDVTARLAAAAGTDWEREHPPVVRAVGLRSNPASAVGSALADRVGAAVEEVTGTRPASYGWHGASDIRFPIRLLGVPAVGLGATAGDFYGPGEWVDAVSWEQTTDVLVRLLRPVA